MISALALLLAACGSSQSNSMSGTAGNPGSISISGSTALLPLVKQAAVDYQSAHANVKISVAGGGSRVGITQVAQRSVDIGDSDIPAQGEPSLVDHRVAVVTFGIVVNPQTGVKNLTTAQLQGIFSGKVTNWSQAGGHAGPITVINRPHSSGTRAVLVQNILGGREPSESGLTQDSSGTVAAMVAQTPGSISYVGMAYVKPGSVTAISIDGVAPADANVLSGRYKYWSFEHMFTNGQPSAQVAGFIQYVTNDTALLSRLKFIPSARIKPV
ncbi:MAG TPA: phosphate ABC transporter substrate-binding protein [Candidatus Rubrimentiphilum sp.]|nr:phosphate ABC transporter substrate-binding protein [Candidatus Rubrimentiphilum sp.]